jgi:hypothetical protein
MTLRAAVAIAALLASSASFGQGAGGSTGLNPFERTFLDAQNAARAAVGAQPLAWNQQLAQHAAEWARQMAQTRQLNHAPREGRGTERENLLSAPIGYSPQQMIQLWTKERSHFVPGIFPNVSNTGDGNDVLHYTQIIWPTTTEVGCGMAPGGGFNWVVCRYNPGGNKDGKPVLDPTFNSSAVAFRNGSATISASAKTVAGETKVSSTVSAPAVTMTQPPKTEPCPNPPAGGTAWHGGDVTVSCTPVFYSPGRKSVTVTIPISPQGQPATSQPQPAKKGLSQAEIDALYAEYGPDVNVGNVPYNFDAPVQAGKTPADAYVETNVVPPELPAAQIYNLIDPIIVDFDPM